MAELGPLVAGVGVVVCVGPGGVGKTTTAAAIALEQARQGRRCAVVTIDPARRLADALGVAGLDDEPRPLAGAGANGGSLHALMLDPRATFEAMVTRHAAGPAQAERILASRFATNLIDKLASAGEYLAMERLHDLRASGAYDLIVVDTPPAQHTLAFLDAPRLVTRLLEHRLYRTLVRPSRGLARAASSATHLVIRQLTRVVGAEVVDDAVSFFRSLEGMEAGFEQRAGEMLELLASQESAFVLVAAPRADTVQRSLGFLAQLESAGITVRAAVVNRVTPDFGPLPEGPSTGSPHEQALADFARLARREGALTARLAAAVDGPVVTVPVLPGDVHDLAGLAAVADRLAGAEWGDTLGVR